MKRTLLGWLTMLGMSAGGGQGASAELKPGDPAPPFKLAGSDGKIHDLAAYRDKQAVVIAWFPKAFTGG